jgi:hypothetical protein
VAVDGDAYIGCLRLAIAAVRLLEYNSHSFFFAPDDLAGPVYAFSLDDEFEPFGDEPGVFASTRAPLSEIFFTLQAIVPPAPKSMMPDFNTRFLGASLRAELF